MAEVVQLGNKLAENKADNQPNVMRPWSLQLLRPSYCAPKKPTYTMVHASIFSFLKSIVNFRSRERSQEIAQTQQMDHEYIRGNIANRGPCPGLNALANQGYLYVGCLLQAFFVAILTAVCTDPEMGKTSL